MKFIFKNAFFYALFLIFPLTVLHFHASYKNPYSVRKSEYINEIKKKEESNIKYILLGDSHSQEIKDEILGDLTHNLSSGGDSVKEMYIKVVYSVKMYKKLEYILLSCDYHMFTRFRASSNNKSFIFPIIDYKLGHEVYGVNWISLKLISLHPLFDPNYYTFERERFKNIIKSIFQKRETYSNEALKEQNKIWGELSDFERQKTAQSVGKGDFSHVLVTDTNEKYYRKMIELCKRKRVKVVGIIYPSDHNYLMQLKYIERLKIDKIRNNLGFDVILDYHDLIKNPKNFRNPDHLNIQGAKLVIKKINWDINIRL